jgi:hypothetical protein
MFYPLGLSITHFRPVADNVSFRGPLCRCSSGNRQLGALKGAAAVDIVFDMATSKTCLRPVPDADSLSFVPVLVGPEPASGSGRCCSRRPRHQHGHLDDLDDLFATCSRCGFAVPRLGSCRARASQWGWTVRQPSTSSSTWPPRRPLSEVFLTTFRLDDFEGPISRPRKSKCHLSSHRYKS